MILTIFAEMTPLIVNVFECVIYKHCPLVENNSSNQINLGRLRKYLDGITGILITNGKFHTNSTIDKISQLYISNSDGSGK